MWGKLPFFRTTKENLRKLQRPNAFLSPNIKIPRTLRDSIELVNFLGMRFLWLDSLCITQDDMIELKDQVENMASIYANSFVTIIAAEGEEAEFGLRGLEGSLPRNLHQDTYNFEGQVLVQDQLNEPPSNWAQRGWTFQEGSLAVRKIIFGNDRVLAAPSPDLKAYFQLVQDYNCRNFSYPEDALPAFTAIMHPLENKYVGGFFCGLPVLFFDIALLWQPICPGTSGLKRRLPVKSTRADCLPSWSWAGWEGPVELNHDNDALYILPPFKNFTLSMSPNQLISTVRWYGYDTQTGAKWRIQSNWDLYRDLWCNENAQPPLGWTRYPMENLLDRSIGSTTLNLEDQEATRENYIYQHKLDPTTEFWLPIPMDGCIQNVAPSQQGYHLFGRTHRTWLRVARNSSSQDRCWSGQTESGEWAGILFIGDEYSSECAPRGPSLETGELCEFAVLSLTEKSNQVDSRASVLHKNWPGADFYGHEREPSGSHKFYNVLWIEWQEGIAYRRALGQIKKDVWDRQPKEDVDLILG
ncbi:MAG: hypothetical protein Q9160_004413 [Pyrenula sp. 1 TL-2023]